MNWKTWIPLLLAVVLGVAALYLLQDYMSKNQNAPVADNSKQIVVVKKDLMAGVQITAEDLITARMSGDLNLDAVFTNTADVEGRVLTSAAIKGAPVLQTMLAPRGASSGLPSLIPDGMRAITVQIDEFSGVAGNLAPGARVDIIATMNAEAGETISRTVVQNIKVQAIGMKHTPDSNGNDAGGGMRSVTLLATPKEAEMIDLAVQNRHRLLLRGNSDHDASFSEGVTISELRGGTGGARDPFASTAELTHSVQTPTAVQSTSAQPAPAPTTQQTVLRQPLPSRHDRQIRVIRGGVESITIVPEASSVGNKGWMTGAETDDMPGIENN